MKPNFLSTRTRRKILTLFWLVYLNTHQVQRSWQFSGCVGDFYIGSKTLYGEIANFVINNNLDKGEEFCCNSCSKSFSKNCELKSFGCKTFNIYGQCKRIRESIFCVIWGLGRNGDKFGHPEGLCGGIVGDSLVSSESVVGNCPNPEPIRSTLKKINPAQDFVWLCCDDSLCTIPTNVEFNIYKRVANSLYRNFLSQRHSFLRLSK